VTINKNENQKNITLLEKNYLWGPRIATEIQDNKVKINNKETHFYGEKGR
jgi:hypothetical protein